MSAMTEIAAFVVNNIWAVLPYFMISIALAVLINKLEFDQYIRVAFQRNLVLSIVLATAVGAFSPFCSCTVIPIVSGLLLSGVPLAPVMAFWIASPTMDPEIFALTVGVLGWPMAVARMTATLVLSLGAGYVTMILTQTGVIGKVVLLAQEKVAASAEAASCCTTEEAEPMPALAYVPAQGAISLDMMAPSAPAIQPMALNVAQPIALNVTQPVALNVAQPMVESTDSGCCGDEKGDAVAIGAAPVTAADSCCGVAEPVSVAFESPVAGAMVDNCCGDTQPVAAKLQSISIPASEGTTADSCCSAPAATTISPIGDLPVADSCCSVPSVTAITPTIGVDADDSCGCGVDPTPIDYTEPSATKGTFDKLRTLDWRDASREMAQESWRIGRWLILAFLMEALIIMFVPQEAIANVLGQNNPFAVGLAATVGVPLYLSNYSALPIVDGLLMQGMQPGAAIAFLIAGPVTTVPAMTAVWGVVQNRIFVLYVSLSLVGAIVLGYAVNLIMM